VGDIRKPEGTGKTLHSPHAANIVPERMQLRDGHSSLAAEQQQSSAL